MELHNIKIDTAGSNDFINVSEKPVFIREIFNLLNDRDVLLNNIRHLRAIIEKEGSYPKTN